MSTTRKSYAEEFEREAVALVERHSAILGERTRGEKGAV